jgi:hypothetical protein
MGFLYTHKWKNHPKSKNALCFGETEEQVLFIYNETKVISCVLKGIRGCDYVRNRLRPAKMVS